MLFMLALALLVVASIAASWVVFEKAGQAGWKALVPIYNAVVMLEIVGRPWWWMLLFLVPLVNLVPSWLVCRDLARSFGKGTGFAIGLALLTPLFFLMLAFGDNAYVGPGGAKAPQRFAKAA